MKIKCFITADIKQEKTKEYSHYEQQEIQLEIQEEAHY